MKKVDIYNLEGKKVASMDLNDQVFGLERNDALVHQVYVAQSANRRSGSAHTKIRSDVQGGGKKPWKQKGTGNARTGSIRNPLWRGGGIIFGPMKVVPCLAASITLSSLVDPVSSPLTSP